VGASRPIPRRGPIVERSGASNQDDIMEVEGTFLRAR